ncbi:MAG: sulfatase-like hydrolase/transferase [Verrucomicrobiota bacterium]
MNPSLLKTLICFLPALTLAGYTAAADRPNILWLSAEDISPHLGCYGDPHAITPNLDKLASEGVRYSHAFTTAGVCAPCRSGIITGMYQTTLGTQHMRCTATLPEEIRPFPVYLRKAGYFCTNNSKQDYQFKTPKDTWDESSGKAHWRMRTEKKKDEDKPFFAVFNFTGCHESGITSASKHRKVTEVLTKDQRQDPKQLTLPPYYPDTPVVREDWKRNYENITAMDHWAGEMIQQLKDDGHYDDTIIFFWSDHGVGMPRGKRWLYDSGTHVPLIVRVPEKFRTGEQGIPGTLDGQLVSSIDLGPTVLKLVGIDAPEHMQGRAFLGTDLSAPREFVYGARDRMDERYDIIRMVRDQRFKYIRNYEPLKMHFQYINTCEKGATMKELRGLYESGRLSKEAAFYFQPTKPVEELYDCDADPYEVNNLGGDPAYAKTLEKMREAHLAWVQETRDLGLVPEPIIAERVKQTGNEYAILRQKGSKKVSAEIGATAVAASEGIEALPVLIEATESNDSAVRYWAATGIGSIGKPAQEEGGSLMINMLKDPSSAVRTAAARALCRMGEPDEALPVLLQELTTGTQWERLYAALVLDEIDEQARPVAEAMKVGLEYQKGFNSDGKYRVRVTNRALNELHGTNNEVK